MGKWLLFWDFHQRPPTKFYNLLASEFNGDCERLQQSVYLARDVFTARRLAAVAESFGASVLALDTHGRRLDDPDREGQAYAERVCRDRRARGHLRQGPLASKKFD